MKNATSRPGPTAGDVLIAHPDMQANPFARTLVYLHTFSREGALGFILNRPMGQALANVTRVDALPDPLRGLPLYFGGPVQADHFILARFHTDADTHLFTCEMNPDPDVFLIPDAPDDVRIRAFMGYAGWSAGQLEEEIDRNDWDWVSPDEAMLRDAPGAEIWELLIGGDTRWRRFRDKLPRDPERN